MNGYTSTKESQKQYIEYVCRKLRVTGVEYPEASILNSVIIGNIEGVDQVGGVKYIFAPTVSETTLGKCSFKVARFFEDC